MEIAKAYDMHDSADSSFHYIIADASGRSAIFEWVGSTNRTDTDGSVRELVITYNDQDAHIGTMAAASDCQWVTNFIIQPDYYIPGEEQPGHDRYDYIGQHLLDSDGVFADEREAMALLGDIGRRTWMPDGVALTIHSIVFNLTEKTVTWVANENYDDPSAWFTYHF